MAELIVSLDLPDRKKILSLVDNLGDSVELYKIGSIVFSAYGPEIIEELRKRGKRIFLDLKFFDIPNTVKNSVKAVNQLGVEFFTVHLLGGEAMVKAAVEGRNESGGAAKILGVTILTSTGEEDLCMIGIRNNVKDVVVRLAGMGQKWGINGLVCSALDLPVLRIQAPSITLVCPGIRIQSGADDQKRTATPSYAVRHGANYIVVGRPVYESDNPYETVGKILEDIENAKTSLD